MKVEVIRTVRYYADGFTPSLHHPGEVVDIPDRFALVFIRAGECSPISDRETKPLGTKDIEVKSHKPASKRTRKPRRPKVEPTDNLDG